MDIAYLTAPLKYEQRIVCFFDILGWKHLIEAAGNDSEKIGKLALLPKILTSAFVRSASHSANGKVTSFSDCAVVSIPYNETSVSNFLNGISNIFIGAALEGFFVRAGVTIGNIYHDDNLVFGPALNRAYHLESNGKYPRIILDEDVEDFRSVQMDIIHKEDALFADPFTLSFFKENSIFNQTAKFFMGGAVNVGLEKFLEIERIICKHMEAAPPGPAKDKMTWLYQRVREQSKKIFSP